jgi:hypothetical protein
LRSVLFSAAAAGAAYAVLLPLGFKVPYPLLFSGFFALVSLRRALRAVAAPGRPVDVRPVAPMIGGVDPDDLSDGIRLAMGHWDTRLSWTERAPDRFESTVRPRLAEIADERLRQRHGVTRATDGRRAREIMGERLWTFLFSPLARAPNPRELAAVVDDMEKL